jgi:hypothetical protein
MIRWPCVNRSASSQIDPKGICIKSAQIDDQLDLEAVTIPFPLALIRCAIPDGVNLRSAKTRLLSFEGSCLGGSDGVALQANGLSVDGSVWLRKEFGTEKEFRAEGTVSLISATIAGNLDCQDGAVP